MTMGAPELRASGFFALRTTLLPVDELRRWSEGLEAADAAPDVLAAALARDRERLRARLRALVARPEVAEALFVASPSLHAALDAWAAAPESARGRRCEEALVRYVARMAARATPFGLCAGSTLGRTGAGATRLQIAPLDQARRSTRLDMEYVHTLAEVLAHDPALRGELTWRTNSSLYAAGGRLRYVEVRRRNGLRSQHLAGLERTEYLDALVERARVGARLPELAAALRDLVGVDAVSDEEARAYVDALVGEQILLPELPPPVTAAEPLDELVRALEPHPAASHAVAALRQARAALVALDARGVGAPPEAYAGVARALEALPVPFDPLRLVQVDLARPAPGAQLGDDVLDELRAGVELLRRVGGTGRAEALVRFREAFVARYGEQRQVPLAEALDDECGPGLDATDVASADPSPFIASLGLGPATPRRPPWSERDAVLLARLHDVWSHGSASWALSDDDVARLTPEGALPALPDALHVMATLAAASPEALARGEFRIAFQNAGGPSGGRLLGRFAPADPELRAALERHLRDEEAHDPEALYAEVVHLPEGRLGNVLVRPLLRGWEIPYLGRSAAAPERQIALTDLRLSVEGGRLVLRSERLARRIVPRLTCAHRFDRGLSVYRLLCLLQEQDIVPGLLWTWGRLEGAPFLPRVTRGRLVLSRARWHLTAAELEPLLQARGAARFVAARRLREARGLPRLAVLIEFDRELPVDFDNALALDAFLAVARDPAGVVLSEFFPAPDEVGASGPEGRFVHELIVPFVATLPAAPAPHAGAAPAATSVERVFTPGSEWLYAKLYAGPATADRLLADVVAPLAQRVRATGAADGWFFLRYGDPDWHLRVRFHGRPARLLGEVLPALHAALDESLRDGRVWRVQLDTYERECERYGGSEGLALCERLFEADSDAVVALLERLPEAGAAARGPWALLGVHRLLDDLGLAPADRRALIRDLLEFTSAEVKAGKPTRLALDRRFREERGRLDALLEAPPTAADDVLRARTRASAAACAGLRQLAADGRLQRPLAAVAGSLVHMHVNRLARAAGQRYELVIYDSLRRLYASRAAREASACDERAVSGVAP